MPDVSHILSLINQYEIAEAFLAIDALNLQDANYSRLKREYIAGKTDIDFIDRLITYVNSLSPQNNPLNMNHKEHLRKLIMNNQIKEAIAELSAATAENGQSDLNDSLILLSSRWNRNEKSNLMGMMDKRDYDIEYNRVVNTLKHYITDEYEPNGKFVFQPTTINSNSNKGTKPVNEPSKNEKKNILFLCASPTGSNVLDFGKEFKKIREALQASKEREKYQISIETGVEADNLLRLLTSTYDRPAIIHISLHASKVNGLYFENDRGEKQAIDNEVLQAIFETVNTEYKPELVILSACNSYAHAEAIKESANNVVGMADFIPDESAIKYAEKFYEMLFDGKSIQLAHTNALLALRIQGLKYQDKNVYEIPKLI